MNSLPYPGIYNDKLPPKLGYGKSRKKIIKDEGYVNFAILKILRLFYNDRIWCNYGR